MNFGNLFKENYLFSIIYFFYYWSIGSYNAFVYLYFKQIGLSGNRIGIIAGLAPFVIIMSQFIWGIVADKIQQKNILISLLNFIVALVALCFPLSNDFYFLILITIIFNFFNSAVGPLTDSATLTFLAEESNTYGKYRLWGSFSFCISTYTTGILSEIYGLRVIFYVYSIAIFIVAILAWNIRIQKIHIGVELSDTQTKTFGELFFEVKKLLCDKKLILFWFGNLLFFIPLNANFVRYSLLWSDLGGNNSLMGFSWTIAAVLEIPIFLFSAKVISKKNAVSILIFASFLAAIRWFIFYSAKNYFVLLIFQPLHSIIFSLTTAAGIYYLNEYAKNEIKYSAQSLLNTICYGIAAVIGNFIAGITYSAKSSGDIYLYLSLTSFISGLVFIFQKKFYTIPQQEN